MIEGICLNSAILRSLGSNVLLAQFFLGFVVFFPIGICIAEHKKELHWKVP